MYHARDLFDRKIQKEPDEASPPSLFVVLLIVMMSLSIVMAIASPPGATAIGDALSWP